MSEQEEQQVEAPERIWIDAAPNMIAGSMRHIYDSPPDADLPIKSVEYVRADLLPQPAVSERRCGECGHNDGVDNDGRCLYSKDEVVPGGAIAEFRCGCQCMLATTGPTDESAWLVEKGPQGYGQVLYICANYMLEWTDDPNKALRLSRREDAGAICSIVEDAERIAEHEWPVATTSRGAGEGRQRCAYGEHVFGEWQPAAYPWKLERMCGKCYFVGKSKVDEGIEFRPADAAEGEPRADSANTVEGGTS